jgi:hypothetical protein
MLNGGMREASMSEIGTVISIDEARVYSVLTFFVAVIPQCPHSIFLLLLKTLYTGDVDFVNPANCVEVRRLPP